MRQRSLLLAMAFGATALLGGCDSLSLPEIDLSGFFGGNHPAARPMASLDVVQQQPDLTLRFHGMELADSTVDPQANEISLHFAAEADAHVIADVQRSAPDWIVGAQAKGDTATIIASKDVDFTTVRGADGFELTLKPRQTAATPEAAPVEPVQTDTLRGDASDPGTDGEIDGLQREGLRGAFGVDDKTDASSGSGL
ncbi:MAG: hypothetical protein ACTHLR_10665 [Rhizomicrobium sp.]